MSSQPNSKSYFGFRSTRLDKSGSVKTLLFLSSLVSVFKSKAFGDSLLLRYV